MSLINDVLRKLDEEGQARHPDAVPASLQTVRRKRRSGAVIATAGLTVALAVGAGVAWGPWSAPEATDPSVTSQPVGDGSAPRSGIDEGQGGASGKPGPAPQEGGRPAPSGQRSQGGAAGETPPAGPVGPASPGHSPVPEPAGGGDGERPSAPERAGTPPVKEGPAAPLKVAVQPAPEESREPSRARTGDPPASRSGKEEPGGVEVSVPRAWQSRQRARRLAREGFQALQAGRYQEAGNRLAEAHRLAPERPDIVNNLGLAQWRAGRHRQAVRTLIDGVEGHPGDARLARNLGNLLRQEEAPGLRERGVRALGKALQRQDRVGLYTVLGALLRDMDRTGEAVSVYRRGTSRQGPHWRLLVGLGGALQEAGQSGEALTVFRKARNRLPAGQGRLADRLDRRIRALEGRLD